MKIIIDAPNKKLEKLIKDKINEGVKKEMEEVKREQIKQDNREPIDDYNAMSDAGMSESDFR